MSAGEGGVSPVAVRVKEEQQWDDIGTDECGASEAAAASLYAEHEVKCELVLGPERLQPQDIPHDHYAYTIPPEWCTVKQEPAGAGPGHAPRSGDSRGEQLALRTCFDKKPHACTICHKTFVRECTLKTHLRIHSAEENSSYITKRNNVFAVSKRKQSYSCDYCGKGFRLKSHLFDHVRIHTGEKPFKCNICTEKFSQKGNLNRHTLIHMEEKSFKCNMCTKQYSRNEHLDRHMQTHTGVKPFKCNMCAKQFSRNEHLARHVQIHLGEKSFSCNICKRFFSQKVNLNTHICNAAPRSRFGRTT